MRVPARAARARSAATCRAPAYAGKPLRPARRPSAYDDVKRGSGKQKVATTMAFVRLLKDLMKDKEIGTRFVPIIPDEARTFGMDSLFPTAKIYSPHGQHYTVGRPRAVPVATRRRSPGRSCTRASTRPARSRRSPPPARRTRRTASR